MDGDIDKVIARNMAGAMNSAIDRHYYSPLLLTRVSTYCLPYHLLTVASLFLKSQKYNRIMVIVRDRSLALAIVDKISTLATVWVKCKPI